MRSPTAAAWVLSIALALALTTPVRADDETWHDDDRESDESWSDGDHWGGHPDRRHDHQIIFDHGVRNDRRVQAPLGQQPPPMRPYWGTMQPYWKPVDPSLATHRPRMHQRLK